MATCRFFGGYLRRKGPITAMSHLRSLPLCAAAAVLLCCPALIAQNAAPSVRIVNRINENQLVMLKGNTHPLAKAKNDRGRVSPELPMTDLVLVLSRSAEQQAAFDKFVASQYDPSSPNFHQWLEPEQGGEEYGPAQGDIDAVSNWLRGHGFSVDEVTKNRMSIRFSGTAAQVGSAFHTEIHNLEVKGVKHIGNMTDPQIPAALAPAVVGVKALHNFFPRPLHRLGSQVTLNRKTGKWERVASPPVPASKPVKPFSPAAGARPLYGINDSTNGYLVEDVVPYDFAAIYNVLPLWSSGINGSGQTIAIAGTSDISATDVNTFRSAFGLPAVKSFTTKVANGTDPGECGVNPTDPTTCSMGDQLENSLDVEWSGAVAPGANLVLVVAGSNSTTTDALYASESYIVSNKTATIMNVSYGLCELGMGTAGNAEYNSLWQSAASEGIAVFVASGDSGSPSCDQGMDAQYGTPYEAQYGLSVSGIASTPYNTAVGGTDLNWGSTASPYWSATNSSTTGASALGYIPEVPWNSTCVNPLVLSSLENDASIVGVSGVTDAESACAFLYDYSGYIYNYYSVDLSWLVDTVGGSGGKSACTTSDGATVASCTGGYTKPGWQAGVTGIPSDGKRDIPDVSFFASNGFNGSAYLICVAAAGSCTYSATSENLAQEVGGTSVASPAMAGVMALINQKAGSSQGNPNASLYALAAKQTYSSCSAESVRTSSSCYFNDIDTGTNAMPCVAGSPNCTVLYSGDAVGILSGYSAVRGFDLATGLGSLNVSNVVKAWPASVVTAPVVSLSPTSLSFAATVQGTAAATQAITLKNTGNTALKLTGISITGANASSFSQTNTCGTSVAAGASCTITVTFRPASSGTLKATVSVADNASGSPQTVALTGTGTAPAVSLSPASLTFTSTVVGSKAATQAVTLKNTGNAALSLSGTGLGISITGTNASSFSQTNTCGTSVAAAASCTITVTFKPAAPGTLKAAVSIADKVTGSPQTVALTGTGTGPAVSLSPASLTFTSTVVGSKAATQAVTLKNTGNAALSLSGTGLGISITGTNASSFSQTNGCGTSMAAGASCAITVTFKPAAPGTLKAAVSIADKVTGRSEERRVGKEC